MTHDLHTLIYLLNLELYEECSGWNPAGLQADACNRGAAVEAGAIREQQPKRTRSGAAAEASVQQQLKRAQSGSAAGSGRKQGAAVEVMQLGSAAAADSKRTQAAGSS